jgi:hypothetical protein
MGRKGRKKNSKNKYIENFTNAVYGLRILCLDNKEIAKYFNVNENTIRVWLHRYPEFKEQYYKGSAERIDSELGIAYRKKAVGFNYKEDVAFLDSDDEIVTKAINKYHPPDTKALSNLVRNRMKFDKELEMKLKQNEFEMKLKEKEFEHRKEMDKKRLELEEKKYNTDSTDEDNKRAIKEFIEATKADEEELDELFEEELNDNKTEEE